MARELTITVTAETSQAESSLNKVEQGLKGVEAAAKQTSDSTKVYESAAGTAGRAATGLGDANAALTNQILKYASYAAIGAAIDRTIEFGSKINDLSIRTGISTDALQSLGFVAEQTGSSMEATARAVTFLDKSVEAGSKKTISVLDDLGLSTTNLLKLDPEERFREVAIAIGKLGSDSEQARAATALFGRGGAELIPMFEALAQGAEDLSVVMREDVVRALDEGGDAMTWVGRQANNLLGLIVAVGIETGKMIVEPFENAAIAMRGFDEELKNVTDNLPKVKEMSEILRETALKGFGGLEISELPPDVADSYDDLNEKLDKQRVEAQRAAAAAERLAEAQRKAYEASIVWGSGIESAIHYVENLTREIDALHTRGDKKLSNILDFENLAFDKPIEDLVRFRNSVTYFSAEGSKAWATYKQAVEQADRTQQRMSFENLSRAFQSLPQTILGAVQGGGNIVGAIGTSLLGGIGQDLGSKVGENIARNIGGALGKNLGALAGPVGGILGSLAGDLAGKLFGKLFGPSQAAQVLQMRNKFVEAAGGMDVLRERAERAGVSMDRLMNARTTSDFQRAMDDFNRQLAAAEKHMQAVAEHTQKFNDELGGLLREANDIGLILPDALNNSMLAMIESGQITGETAELLRSLGQGGQSQFKAMEDAAKKYGIELSALGPAFQQNKLDKTAGEIIDAFNVLMKGGADVTGVIAGMSDEINKFVQEAVKSGRTVPENMRPILDEMLKQGKLTDENGQKLSDLSKIQFGPPIETAMDRLIKKIEELIDKFEKGMPKAFDSAASASEKFAQRVGTAIEGIPDRIEFGNDTPGFDVGGVVGRHYRPPTSRDVIPALLRPGEVVLTPEQASRGLSRGGDTAVSVVINVAGYLDSSTARANLADVVKTELSKQLRREGRAA